MRTTLAVVLIALGAATAHAQQWAPEGHRPYFRDSGWRLPAGFNFGAALHHDSKNQAFFGLELGLDHLGADFWYRLGTDLTAEFDGPTRIGIAPGVGWHGYSLAAGYVGQLAAHSSRSGLSLRVEASLAGLLGLFVRWDRFLSGSDRNTGELGVFFRWPLFEWLERPAGIYCGNCMTRREP